MRIFVSAVVAISVMVTGLVSERIFALSPPPAAHFKLEVKGKYQTRIFILYQKAAQWICHSNDSPYFEMRKNPLENWKWSEWKQVKKLNCAERVMISDRREKKERHVEGCLDERQFSRWVEQIANACSPEARP